MWQTIKIEKILFLDIETVPKEPSYQNLDDSMKKFWDKKASFIKKNEDQSSEDLYTKAGIYAEFAKIICISFGIFYEKNYTRHIRIKSLINDDEKSLLLSFADLLNKIYQPNDLYLCAHNGKEFDFPFLARRMLINGIKLPEVLNVSGFKPWETPFIDTLELWKFGDYKHYTSLNLLAYLFNIPSPKQDIDGSDVAKVYYEDHDLKRIAMYCMHDVLTIMQLFLKFRGDDIVHENNITFIFE